jgi:hypothetical protein
VQILMNFAQDSRTLDFAGQRPIRQQTTDLIPQTHDAAPENNAQSSAGADGK